MAKATGSMLLLLLMLSGLQLSSALTKHAQNGNSMFQIVFEEDEYSLPVPDMIRSYGYTCEEHQYVTEDGYINTLHRIPARDSRRNGRVAFLQHGLMGTSADYVMGSPNVSLGYLLSDRGYDVWLGNARGNAYSRAHVNLTLDSDDYWRFSFDEMGRYDLPAAFHHVRNATGAESLFYVGHSMGTVMFWVAALERPDVVERSVELAVAMGPVATVRHMVSPVKYLSCLTDDIVALFHALGIREFSPANWVTRLFDRVACDPTMRQLELCENFLFLLTGFDAKQTNMSLLPIILGHEPGGTSTQTVIHFAQEYKSGKFSKFDYGAKENLKRYNSTSPPEYDVTGVNVPVALMYSDNDWLADPQDVKETLFKLPNLVDTFHVPDEDFNHVDFLWALEAPNLIYQRIFKYFDEHQSHI